MNITTDRLIILKFINTDWKSVHHYTSNRNVMKYMPEGVISEEDTKKFVIENAGENAKNFPVVLRKEQKLIGHIVFHRYFGNHTYEIGWVFNPNYYNNGYATEAAYSVLNYGFETLNLHRIIATCQPENIPSWKVMEKIGMRKEGYFKKCIPNGNEWWDEYYYAILHKEWNPKC